VLKLKIFWCLYYKIIYLFSRIWRLNCKSLRNKFVGKCLIFFNCVKKMSRRLVLHFRTFLLIVRNSSVCCIIYYITGSFSIVDWRCVHAIMRYSTNCECLRWLSPVLLNYVLWQLCEFVLSCIPKRHRMRFGSYNCCYLLSFFCCYYYWWNYCVSLIVVCSIVYSQHQPKIDLFAITFSPQSCSMLLLFFFIKCRPRK